MNHVISYLEGKTSMTHGVVTSDHPIAVNGGIDQNHTYVNTTNIKSRP